MRGFLKEFVTPIIKVKAKNSQTTFFTINEFKEWEKANKTSISTVKYYKGLGTSSQKEAKEYFSDLQRHVISFTFKDEACKSNVNLAFSKSMADSRKDWLSNFDEDSYVDHNIKQLSYQDFVNKELIHFSVADNMRSIPSLVDGLKPG